MRALTISSEQFNLYADSAFMLTSYLILPFNEATADVAGLQFNSDMSAVRVAEEWNYKDFK